MYIFRLSSHLSILLSSCEQLDFSEILHVVKGFLNQSDCRTFQTSILKKQVILNMYQGIIMALDIL